MQGKDLPEGAHAQASPTPFTASAQLSRAGSSLLRRTGKDTITARMINAVSPAMPKKAPRQPIQAETAASGAVATSVPSEPAPSVRLVRMAKRSGGKRRA